MDLARLIDHTMLKPDASIETIRQYCVEAKQYCFASVCVNSRHVRLVAAELKGSNVLTCSVVGFPLGAMSTPAKAFETEQAISDGAQEIDMVIDISAAKENCWDQVESDIAAVVEAAAGRPVKVIIETCLLTDEEKVKACQAAESAGAQFVKTSTGFSTAGANVHDIELMRSVVADRLGVKASGGIRTPNQAKVLVEAGASRLGAGDGLKLIGKR